MCCVAEAVIQPPQGKKYDSNESASLSKELCTEIKEKVKEIGAPRHKLVVQVTIGEVQGQGVRIASRYHTISISPPLC